MKDITFVRYSRCTTCKRAAKWLSNHAIVVTVRDIKENHPTEQELRAWHKKSGLPLKRFFIGKAPGEEPFLL